MSKAPSDHTACDNRMLFLLRALHDVHGANKSALYRNASEKSALDALIEHNFVEEVPTPFSNKRTCVITQRGRVLFEALAVVDEIWTSKPDSEIIIRVSNTRKTEDSENSLTETPLESTNDASEVSEHLGDIEDPSMAYVDESAFIGGKLYDADGHLVAERIDMRPKQQTLEELSQDVPSEDTPIEDAGQDEVSQDVPQEDIEEVPVEEPSKKAKKKEASE